MNLNKLNAIVSKYLRIIQYGDRPRPLRDWWIIVSLSLVLLALSAGWSYFVFRQVSGADSTTTTVAPAPLVNPASIDAVRTIFTTRAEQAARYRTDQRFVDPSR